MPVKAVFFDAAGTLFGLAAGVGEGYAAVGRSFGLTLDPARTEAAFRAAWRRMPPYGPGRPEPDDGKSWWRRLVGDVLAAEGPPNLPWERREAYFEALYAHYGRPEQWTPFPEVHDVLRRLHNERRFHLAVLSNFDRRLFGILAGLGLRAFFADIVISSEIGFSKPDPRIFAAACGRAGFPPHECLHAGDDADLDWAGARAAGFQVFELDRRTATLADVVEAVA